MAAIILDVATCALPDAASWLDGDEIKAPANYKDEQKIAAYIAEARQQRLARAALDPDCCMISALGFQRDGKWMVVTCRHEDGWIEGERNILQFVAEELTDGAKLVTFNGLKFDLPILQRRAIYLDVDLTINLDRYRSPHVDIYDVLTCKGLTSAHALGWYRKRFGWIDIAEKPLTGEQEALAPQQGLWDELIASVRHDVAVTARLAERLRVIPAVRAQEPIF
jgi:hypothetical protein